MSFTAGTYFRLSGLAGITCRLVTTHDFEIVASDSHTGTFRFSCDSAADASGNYEQEHPTATSVIPE